MTNVLNTLYVTTPNAWVGQEGDSLRVRVERETRVQVPMHHLVAMVCLGPVSVSPAAMHACAEAGITIAFLDPVGRFLARVEGPMAAGSVLRRAQHRVADDASKRVQIARSFVAGKIANSRTQLRRAGRTREHAGDVIDRAADRLMTLGTKALDMVASDSLLGVEGEAAALYFGAFDEMLGDTELRFERRSRRPPQNAVNAMLSFGYALLNVDCQAALQAVGLDPCLGFLHAARPGRPALALDLMEELRSPIVDRLVLAMVRRAQVSADDFETLPTGEVRMKDATRKSFLVEYQNRKRDEVAHALAAEPVPWALVPHIQARQLARVIRGEGQYVPFLLK